MYDAEKGKNILSCNKTIGDLRVTVTKVSRKLRKFPAHNNTEEWSVVCCNKLTSFYFLLSVLVTAENAGVRVQSAAITLRQSLQYSAMTRKKISKSDQKYLIHPQSIQSSAWRTSGTSCPSGARSSCGRSTSAPPANSSTRATPSRSCGVRASTYTTKMMSR